MVTRKQQNDRMKCISHTNNINGLSSLIREDFQFGSLNKTQLKQSDSEIKGRANVETMKTGVMY